MSLRAQRRELDSDITFFMNEVATRGGFVCASTVGSGAALDQADALATYAANPSGKTVLGVLMCDMVNLDLTRQKENVYKEEVQKGGKVTIWTKGWVVTDMIYPGHTIAAGNKAYIGPSGLIGNVDVIGGNDVVGKFLSKKDEDGYAKVSFNLP